MPQLPALQINTDIDTETPLRLYQQGADAQAAENQRSVLERAGQRAAIGDYLAAAQEAYRGGELQAGAGLEKMGIERKAQLIDALAKGAERATTPEMWRAYVGTLAQTFGPESVQGFEDFRARPSALTTLQKARLEMQAYKIQMSTAKPTAAMRNAEAAGLRPGTPEYTQFMQKQGGGPIINLPGQEKAFGKKYGGKLADRMIKLEDQAAGANQMLGQYETISALLNDPNVYTGTGAEFVQWVKKTGESLFGLEIEGVSEGEAASKFRNLAVGKVREMLGDTRMSDADRKVYQETIPGLSDTKEGIILTTELMRQAANRAKTAEAKAFELMMAGPAPGQMNAAKWAEFRKWERDTPIFDAETVSKAQELAKQKGKRRPPTAGSEEAWQFLQDKYGLEK